MEIKVNLRAETVICGGGDLICSGWSHVRNEISQDRLLSSIAVKSENVDGSDGVPYMPRAFPVGEWLVTHIVNVPEDNKYLYPLFIGTNAHQTVDEWLTNYDGSYLSKSGRTIEDYGYGMHFSSSDTTLGCIRVEKESDIRTIVALIKPELDAGRPVKFVVI